MRRHFKLCDTGTACAAHAPQLLRDWLAGVEPTCDLMAAARPTCLAMLDGTVKVLEGQALEISPLDASAKTMQEPGFSLLSEKQVAARWPGA